MQWPLLNDFARVPVCGLIAQYNATTPMPGPDIFSVLRKRLLVRGFIVSDFASRQADFLRDVGEWVRTGRLKFAFLCGIITPSLAAQGEQRRFSYFNIERDNSPHGE
jgi:NADPH-dependent curcumin reductase CurA